MKAATLDARRRLTMPSDLPPLSVVTIESSGKDTWIVRRLRRSRAPQTISVSPLKAEEARRAFGRDVEQESFEAAMSASQVFPLPGE